MRLAVFASGRGSNLDAILSAIKRGDLSAQVVLVVSNNESAGALQTARRSGIPHLHINRDHFDSDAAFDNALLRALTDERVEIVALAGYLKRVSPAVVARYKNRILNIHPALLPAFGGKGMYGMKVHQAVLDYGCKVSGVTVHLVDSEYDSGPPILQRCVAVADSETAESLAAKVLRAEHEVYSQALQLFAEGRVRIDGRTVEVA